MILPNTQVTLLVIIATLSIYTQCAYTKEISRESGEDEGPNRGLRMFYGLCLPRSTDTLVYRNKNQTHIYIGFDLMKKSKVQVFSWELLKAANSTYLRPMKETEYLAIDFRRTVKKRHIIGAVGKHTYRRFVRKLHKKMESCTRHKRLCQTRSVKTVFVRLSTKMRKVSFDGKCHEDPITVIPSTTPTV